MVMPAAEAGLQHGTLIMQPEDSSLQPKEVPLETFFHKIVTIRNNLRVLEQKVNASDKLSEADKFDLQQYITRCYGSLTTFNILFKTRTTSSEPAQWTGRTAEELITDIRHPVEFIRRGGFQLGKKSTGSITTAGMLA
jgi:hypothetical protein